MRSLLKKNAALNNKALLGCLVLAAQGLVGCSNPAAVAPAHDGELTGLFRFTPGVVADGKTTGTYFRMVTRDRKSITNRNSPAEGGAVTLLAPGREGGLRTESFQSFPSPAFAGTPTNPTGGDSLADSVTVPTLFFNVKFSISTNAVDPQTRRPVSPPKVLLKDGKLTADVSSWAATWNGQYFNQGAPKPQPANDAEVQGVAQVKHVWDWVAQKFLDVPVAEDVPQGPGATGTYDSKTKHYTLDWSSLINGGPFNGFTGEWHLEGVFEPADNPTDPSASASP